jgi:putative transcriptional regulator
MMKKEIFEELLSSVKQAVAIERGERKPGRVFTINAKTDVAKARARLGLSQEKFAALLGISPATLRNWEQGRREPNGAAKVLLKVALRHPRVVLEGAA